MTPDLPCRVPAAVLLAGLVACSAPAPGAPVAALPGAADTLTIPIREASGGVHLGGTRWAVVSSQDGLVRIVDFATREVRDLATGPAAAELANPVYGFLAGDTLALADWGRRGVSYWAPASGALRFAGRDSARTDVRGALPRARDEQGRLYAELYPLPGPDGSGNRDSAAVLRWAPGAATVDTVARLAPLDLAKVDNENGERFERRVFSGQDRWGLTADGAIWIARVYQNRVDRVVPGGETARGEPLPDRVLEVTRYDRELFIRSFPPELRSTAENLPFAAVKPPFEQAMARGGAEIWLERSRAPVDSSRGYLVVPPGGALAREWRLAGQGRVIAVSATQVLSAERGEGGLRLAVHPLTPATATKTTP